MQDDDDWERYLTPGIKRAIKRSKKAPGYEFIRDERALAPGSAPGVARGYGGSDEWPFSFDEAVRHGGYRAGVRAAAFNRSGYYNSVWQYYAREWLLRVDDTLTAKREARKYLEELIPAIKDSLPRIEYDKQETPTWWWRKKK